MELDAAENRGLAAMKLIKVIFEGKSPLLMHSAAGVDKFHPITKEIKKLTDKKTKRTDAEDLELRRLEWQLAIYWDNDLGVYMPSANIVRSIRDGAAKRRLGQDVYQSVYPETDKVALQFGGPNNLEKLWDSGQHTHTTSVKIGRVRTMRTRPIFTTWKLNFEITLDENIMNESDLLEAAQTAGRLIGIGDWRPQTKGTFGRYSVTFL